MSIKKYRIASSIERAVEDKGFYPDFDNMVDAMREANALNESGRYLPMFVFQITTISLVNHWQQSVSIVEHIP